MKTTVFFFVFLQCIGVAHAVVRCYGCTSSSGWDDCVTRTTNCRAGYDQCGKTIVQMYDPASGSRKKLYAKRCLSKDDCAVLNFETSKICADYRNNNPGMRVSCQAFCCSGDLCNTERLKPKRVKIRGLVPETQNWDKNRSFVLELMFLASLVTTVQVGALKTPYHVQRETYQPFVDQAQASACMSCPNATKSNEPLTDCPTDRQAASSPKRDDEAEKVGEIAGGVLGSIFVLVVLYMALKKRRSQRNQSDSHSSSASHSSIPSNTEAIIDALVDIACQQTREEEQKSSQPFIILFYIIFSYLNIVAINCAVFVPILG
ncbi:hypothetical protein OS493_023964 [Desmophyllum pertusum]|uniref:Uncharacterized protein n=1 Tax=Desmophyllum pertusum TaxID=174260 RepID=A0A9W9ZZ91_9CNID|nr:hypothetical protein OS493_023964 [Desmophyllum pertusum]